MSPAFLICASIFLLTPLREGRHFYQWQAAFNQLFLLTPLREGRLECQRVGGRAGNISTHAPAGGATRRL